MNLGITVTLLVAGIIATAGVSSAYAQDQVIRGTYAIRMPPGAFDQNSAVFYDPPASAIPAGTTVVWFNDDPGQMHTVTSGTGFEDANFGSVFDSGFMSEGAFFQHTFDAAGEFPYFCQLHPWMVGKVTVSDAFEQGHNFKFSSGTGPVFDFSKNERTLLRLEPTSIELDEDEPVTYKIIILKNGEEAFSNDFRSLGGDLYLELIPTDTDTRVYGPDIGDPIIGAYHVEGSFLKDNAAYTVRAEITQIFDRPPEDQIGDDFGVQIVPEFPLGILLPVVAGIGATIFAGRRLGKL